MTTDNTTKIFVKRSTLMDGSYVYDIEIGNPEDQLEFAAYNEKAAEELAYGMQELLKKTTGLELPVDWIS